MKSKMLMISVTLLAACLMAQNTVIPDLGNIEERDVVTIGTGTSTQPQPFGMLYGYERSMSLYLSSEIGISGTITQLQWYVASGTNTAKPLKIYLKHTSSSSLSSSIWSTSGATLVYQANVMFHNTGYNYLNLSTSFEYNNSNNLLVMCETDAGGTGISNYPTFRYSSSTSRHQLWRADYNPPTNTGTVNSNRPNIRINIDASDDNDSPLSATLLSLHVNGAQ